MFPNVSVSEGFFHLGQSAGLQAAYSDPNDRNLKDFVHAMLAFAFVPYRDVVEAFVLLRRQCPERLLVVMDYFDDTYLRGRPGRGRRAAVPPRYSKEMWNEHSTAVQKEHRTNNISEGWHNSCSAQSPANTIRTTEII